MIKICHLTIDHPHQPVSLLRVLPYAKLKNVINKFMAKNNQNIFESICKNLA